MTKEEYIWTVRPYLQQIAFDHLRKQGGIVDLAGVEELAYSVMGALDNHFELRILITKHKQIIL